MKKTVNSTFRPAWWLASPHLQTLWPTFFRSRPGLPLKQERLELTDGDFIDLACYPRKHSPVVLFIHGLEGSLHSHYAKPALKALHEAGFGCVFIHLRGCSGTPNRLARSYHSGLTSDISEVIAHLRDTGRAPDAAIGISLGGNLILKYLGETGALSGLQAAVAVSAPFQLQQCAQKLEQGFSKIYGRYLTNKLKHSYRHKFSRIHSPLDVDIDQVSTVFSFDDQVTAPLNGFSGAEDYYTQNSSGQFLGKIRTPTLIIHAQDDPFMYPKTAPTEDMLSDSVELELTAKGGHVGFISGNNPLKPQYWLDRRIASWLQERTWK